MFNIEDCKTPEDALLALICQKRGKRTFIQLDELVSVAKEHGITELKKPLRKTAIAEQLIPLIDCHAFSIKYGIGVKSIDLQKKFGITNAQVKKLAKAEIFDVVGKEMFWTFGKCRFAPLYDIWQYFEMTPEEVQQKLAQLQKPYISKTVRIDKKVHQESQKLFSKVGLDMTTAINIFLRQAIHYGGFPFEIRLTDEERKRISEQCETHDE